EPQRLQIVEAELLDTTEVTRDTRVATVRLRPQAGASRRRTAVSRRWATGATVQGNYCLSENSNGDSRVGARVSDRGSSALRRRGDYDQEKGCRRRYPT